MEETQPVVQALPAPLCNEDTTSHQSPSKRKSRLQSQSKQGNSSSKGPPSPRYTRSQAAPDWTVQEVLVLLGEIVAIDEVWLKELSSYQRWKMVSDSCMVMNVVRSSNQCKRKWEMLLDDYRKIMKWESGSREDSYWFLLEEKRKDYGLPVSFQKEVFDAMDAVVQVEQQLSDSNNSDPERIINVAEFETSNVNDDSEISMQYLPPPVQEEEELVITSKSLEVEEPTLKSPEKALVLAGDELITTSKSPEVEELITTSKCSEERPEIEELNTTLKSLEERPEVEELITTSKSSEERPELEELNTISKSLEDRPEVVELNTTSKSLEDRPEVEELNTTSKSLEHIPQVEELITTSKSPEVEELITTSKSSEVEHLITPSKSPEVGELITTSKGPEKARVMAVFEEEELINNSKSSEKARVMASKLQENAVHVCAILRGELQDGANHGPSPMDSLKPSAAETQFARRQAEELIKALAGLTNTLDELHEHIDRRGGFTGTGIVPIDSMD